MDGDSSLERLRQWECELPADCTRIIHPWKVGGDTLFWLSATR